jgi:hypothetical protein
MAKYLLLFKMPQLDSFSVWIYDVKTGRGCYKTNYVFSYKRPDDLPKFGILHITVTVDEAGQNLSSIESEYIYGPCRDDVIIVHYNQEELASVEANLVGTGSFLQRIVEQINNLSPCQREELVEKYDCPCFGTILSTLIHLFIFQLATTLVLLAWLNATCFWKLKLLPLFVTLPVVEGFITRNLLKLLTIFIVYTLAVPGKLPLKPVLEIALCLVDNWDGAFVCGNFLDGDLILAELNLGLLKRLCVEAKPKQKDEEEWDISVETLPSACEPSSFLTGESLDVVCTKYQKAREVYTSESSVDFASTYRLLETKKREVEKEASQAAKSLSGHFSTLSHEVVGYAMTEVRQRLEGCVEECIYKSYPRIETYIQSALQEKSDYFFLLKEQLELEVNRVRDVCQQAFLVLEAVPHYEERIRYLEQEIKALKCGRKGDTDLHCKVEHLQSTVSHLLKVVRCRP